MIILNLVNSETSEIASKENEGVIKMITLLFENNLLLNKTSFVSDLINHSEFKLLKRRSKDITTDVAVLKPDILFIDLTNDSEGFIEKLEAIRRRNSNVKIILLVNYCSNSLVLVAKKFGLTDIIQKDIKSEEIYSKLMTLTETPTTNSFSEDKPLINFVQLENILTNSEKEVFKLIGNGLTTKEISYSLNLSCRTIDKHRENILNKIGCKSAAMLIFVQRFIICFRCFN